MEILNNGIKLISLECEDYYHLGYEFARESYSLIIKGISEFEKMLNVSLNLSLNEFSKLFLDETSYIRDAKEFAPNSIDKIRGIADYLDLSIEDVFTYSAIDEIPVFINNYTDKYTVQTENCTSIAVKSLGNTLLAHNNDLPYTFKDTQIVLSVTNKSTENKYLTTTLAGIIAQSSINKYGLAVSVNTMSMLNLGKSGLIGTVILNELLNKKSVDEAVEWLRSVPIAGGVNYCIADVTKIVSVETSHNKVTVINKEASENFIVHTNHPLNNDDFNTNTPSYKLYEQSILMFEDAPNKTHERYRKSINYLSNLNKDLSINNLIKLMTTEPINNKSSKRNFGTILSSIANLSDLSLWVAGEFPRKEDYVQLFLKNKGRDNFDKIR